MSRASIPTLNRKGRTTASLNELSKEFVRYSRAASRPVLDIGAAFGVASLAALKAGARVIANDIDPRHLKVLVGRTPRTLRPSLATICARFPDEMELEEGSLSAVHAANLLNFLTGPEIAHGLRLIVKWLEPGGKLFVISGTPYAANVRGFIQEYHRRKRRGDRWPGYVRNLKKYSSDPTVVHELPDALHLLDDEILCRECKRAGLVVEQSKMFLRKGLPKYLRLDGRENVLLVARKPTTPPGPSRSRPN